MRLVEVTCIPIYIYQILFSTELLSVAVIRMMTEDPTTNLYIIGDGGSGVEFIDFKP